MESVFKRLRLEYKNSKIPFEELQSRTHIKKSRLKNLMNGKAQVIYLYEFVKIKDAIEKWSKDNEKNGKT